MSEKRDERPRVAVVAQHYSGRRERSRAERQRSVTYALKCFNNWLKSVLIARFVARGDAVLDLAGGKGGDLAKFARAHVASLLLVRCALSAL